jgi:hypothetical protein
MSFRLAITNITVYNSSTDTDEELDMNRSFWHGTGHAWEGLGEFVAMIVMTPLYIARRIYRLLKADR